MLSFIIAVIGFSPASAVICGSADIPFRLIQGLKIIAQSSSVNEYCYYPVDYPYADPPCADCGLYPTTFSKAYSIFDLDAIISGSFHPCSANASDICITNSGLYRYIQSSLSEVPAFTYDCGDGSRYSLALTVTSIANYIPPHGCLNQIYTNYYFVYKESCIAPQCTFPLVPNSDCQCVCPQESCCEDKDGDGHYAISPNCPQGDDCDDNDPTVHPGAPEICDGKDNDCNGVIDDLCPVLGVPLFKQCASPWGTDIYDHTTSTICKKGCALTSAVMVLRYYGVTTGKDGKEVNPGNLNEWLIGQQDGYDRKGNINWNVITRYSGNKVIFTRVDSRNDELLNSDLCNGQPPIIRVPNHFVVATSAICAGSDITWTINDPGRNITTLQGYGNTYLGLRRTRFQ